ncbi:MAG: hypothetical protein E6R03_08000 [Hyphomicrobiaceae bacterium]|nr:MAG: hypothetical protein E6R03_08000 [Hyphomicrobiaceae bacterium]
MTTTHGGSPLLATDIAEAVVAILATSGALHTANMANEPGHDPNAWRTWGGPMCEIVEITGSTDGPAITGECWIYGIRVTATGTSTTLGLHQGTDNTGVNLLPGILTATLNVLGYEKQVGFGAAVHCPNGLYADWGGSGSPKVALFVVRSQPS